MPDQALIAVPAAGALAGPDDLVALVRSYNPRSSEALIRQAWAFGERMHDGQLRRSGEPYFTHPVAVARILAEQRMDDATIVTALLHDTVEDTKASRAQIEREFGPEVAELVEGVTNLTKMQIRSDETRQAENFRKLFMATSRDLRVTLVKLADRLHNMRTIKSMSPEKQAQKARETMDIYAPLAGRMGMQWMREELGGPELPRADARSAAIGDAPLHHAPGRGRHRHPEDRGGHPRAPGARGDRGHRHRAGEEALLDLAQAPDQGPAFSRLSDIYGFRIICGTAADCYRVLGAVHQRWRAVPGRFKDYISQPKSNGYRSIHTTVSGRDGKQVEVQVRTQEMHEVAESGVAAHWSYKDGVRSENRFAVDPVRWIAQMTERFEEGQDHGEFLEAVKLEMYQDQVFCFTPKGHVIPLPKGATPIDFAYAIHTRIGHATVGAKVDGVRVPLYTRLRNGQMVEIITAEGQTPQATWIGIAVTGRAKSAIRRALREEDRERFVKLGAELARVAFENVGKKATDKALRTAAKAFGLEDEEDLLARLGSAEMTGRQVVSLLYPDLARRPGEEVDEKRAVVGLSPGQAFRRAPCCQPVPGERIVGITHRGQGVVVHAIDCPALASYEDEGDRWVDLHWQEGTHRAVNTVSLELTISNGPGVLGRVCTLIGEQSANISDLVFTDRKPDYYRLLVDVDLRNAEHLHRVMTALDAETNVSQVLRHRDPKRAAPVPARG
jgi:GTP pyrophosphokinase